jgi:cobalt-zinc-cadmium efflux system outer membrane protein
VNVGFLRSVAATTLAAVLSSACVSSDAGYHDVKRLTAERIRHDVRWSEHESQNGRPRTKELLSRPLTADAAVELALLNNQSVQAAFEELGVSRAELVRAFRLPNPELEASLRFHGESAAPAIELEATLDVSELILLAKRGSAAGAELDAATTSVAGELVDLSFDVRAAFTEYQAAAQSFELEQLHQAGNITDLTFANERVLYEESRVAHAQAATVLAVRREELNALMGLWGKQARWSADPRLPALAPVDTLVAGLEARAVERSLELEIIRRPIAQPWNARTSPACVVGRQSFAPVSARSARAETSMLGASVRRLPSKFRCSIRVRVKRVLRSPKHDANRSFSRIPPCAFARLRGRSQHVSPRRRRAPTIINECSCRSAMKS